MLFQDKQYWNLYAYYSNSKFIDLTFIKNKKNKIQIKTTIKLQCKNQSHVAARQTNICKIKKKINP